MDIRAIRDAITRAATPALKRDQLVIPGAGGSFDADQPAVKVGLGDNGFLNKLERHIKDYRDGRGDRSPDVSAELKRREISTSLDLNPSDLALYGAYTSALRYDRKARFINGVSEGQEVANAIQSAPAKVDDLAGELARLHESVEPKS